MNSSNEPKRPDVETPPHDDASAAEMMRLRHERAALSEQLKAVRQAFLDTQARAQRLERQLQASSVLRRILSPFRRLLGRLIDRLSPARAARAAAIGAYRERRKLILLPDLLELLPPQDRFVIVDGGAREVDQSPYWRPFPPSRLKFIGFEPDADEAARLNATPGTDGIERQFVAAGLWGSTGTQTFYNNHTGGGSSFLDQNRILTDRWKFENPTESRLSREMFFPESEATLKVVSLSDWSREANVDSIDFLKLNVQGGELEILKGADRVLESVLGILVEVAFVELYRERPMFSDIDQFLRQEGFVFFDLLAHHYVGRAEAPVVAQQLVLPEPALGQLVSSWGQLIEGHALYLRDPIGEGQSGKPDAQRAIKLAALAEVFGQFEYAFELLSSLCLAAEATDAALSKKLRAIIEAGASKYNAHSSRA